MIPVTFFSLNQSSKKYGSNHSTESNDTLKFRTMKTRNDSKWHILWTQRHWFQSIGFKALVSNHLIPIVQWMNITAIFRGKKSGRNESKDNLQNYKMSKCQNSKIAKLQNCKIADNSVDHWISESLQRHSNSIRNCSRIDFEIFPFILETVRARFLDNAIYKIGNRFSFEILSQ